VDEKGITMLLLQCRNAQQTEDEGKSCVLITSIVVRPKETSVGPKGDSIVEYVEVHRTKLPEDYVPSGQLVLTQYPGGEVTSLTVEHYSVGALFSGPVMFFFTIYGIGFDASPFIGNVYSVKEVVGTRGLEPLIRD
jgi:hypothetical protein